jgi:hypothetical protein
VLADVDVARRLRPLVARRVWIALAACYAGGFTEVLGPGRILTGAAGADSVAYENASYGRWYLVEFMVRRAMLEGRAAGSVEQAFAWAEASLRREHPDRVPVQRDAADGELVLGASRPSGPVESSSTTTSTMAPQPPDSAPPAPEDDEQDQCVLRLGTLVGCGG